MEMLFYNDDLKLIKVVYTSKHAPRWYDGVGRVEPRHTLCEVFVNGGKIAEGEVIKHAGDIDNLPFALKAATKKALKLKPFSKQTREYLWRNILTRIKEEYGS